MDIKEKIEAIKRSRLKPDERWFIELINELEIVEENDILTSYKKNNQIYIQISIYENGDGDIDISEDLIFNVLIYKFGYDVHSAFNFFGMMFKNQFNLDYTIHLI